MSLVAGELLKLRTVRVPYGFVVLVGALSAIAAAALVGSGALGDDEDPALSLAQGASFSGILVLVLGILIVTNEYRHGTVDSTFLAEPTRVRVLLAKVAAAVIAAALVAAAAMAVSLAVAVPWLSARGEPLPGGAALGEAALRVGAVFVLNCLLGIGIGAVIQNQVGAIVAALSWFFVGESVLTLIAALVGDGVGEPDRISQYLPGSALQGILGFSQGEGADEFLLDPLPAALLSLAYAAALVALGALAMTRRDP